MSADGTQCCGTIPSIERTPAPQSVRNRIAVAIDWLWSYLTYQRGARLITGEDM